MNTSHNPYAAPAAPPPSAHPARAPVTFGPSLPWTVGEVFGLAKERFAIHWAVIVFSYVVMMFVVEGIALVPAVLSALSVLEPDSVALHALTAVCVLVQVFASAYFQVGLIRLWVDVAQGKTPSFGTMFTGFDRVLTYVASLVIMGIAVGIGFVCLVVPAVFLSLGWCLSPFILAITDKGPVDTLSTSWAMTKGHRGNLFVLGLSSLGLALLGVLMCGVGVFVTVPFSYIAFAIAFTRIAGMVPQEGSDSFVASAPRGAGIDGYAPQGPLDGPPGYVPPR